MAQLDPQLLEVHRGFEEPGQALLEGEGRREHPQPRGGLVLGTGGGAGAGPGGLRIAGSVGEDLLAQRVAGGAVPSLPGALGEGEGGVGGVVAVWGDDGAQALEGGGGVAVAGAGHQRLQPQARHGGRLLLEEGLDGAPCGVGAVLPLQPGESDEARDPLRAGQLVVAAIGGVELQQVLPLVRGVPLPSSVVGKEAAGLDVVADGPHDLPEQLGGQGFVPGGVQGDAGGLPPQGHRVFLGVGAVAKRLHHLSPVAPLAADGLDALVDVGGGLVGLEGALEPVQRGLRGLESLVGQPHPVGEGGSVVDEGCEAGTPGHEGGVVAVAGRLLGQRPQAQARLVAAGVGLEGSLPRLVFVLLVQSGLQPGDLHQDDVVLGEGLAGALLQGMEEHRQLASAVDEVAQGAEGILQLVQPGGPKGCVELVDGLALPAGAGEGMGELDPDVGVACGDGEQVAVVVEGGLGTLVLHGALGQGADRGGVAPEGAEQVAEVVGAGIGVPTHRALEGLPQLAADVELVDGPHRVAGGPVGEGTAAQHPRDQHREGVAVRDDGGAEGRVAGLGGREGGHGAAPVRSPRARRRGGRR